jgi:hypothetical protein
MSEARNASMARVLTAIITAGAWFFVSNHCVLAELREAQKTKASCHQPCCGDQSPVKHKTDNATECCKTLRTTLSGTGKEFAGYDGSLFELQLYFIGPVISTNEAGRIPAIELDTGPPFRSTFAESVLQRSILAHAPPFALS